MEQQSPQPTITHITVGRSASHNGRQIHSEDVQDIISAPPAALMRWGITWVLVVLLVIVALSVFIKYPDVVIAPIRVNAVNAPKPVVSRVAGNLVNILVEDGQAVKQGQELAWMESTADHQQVLDMLERLERIRDSLYTPEGTVSDDFVSPSRIRLGELQPGYQAFYQSYLSYRAAKEDGIYRKQRDYLLRDMVNIGQQRAQLVKQQELQQREFNIAETEFMRYEQLADKKVISPAEYQKERAALLAKQHPLQQTASSLLSIEAARMGKTRELADLDNKIAEERAKFQQALNSLVSEMQQWKMLNVLTAPTPGSVIFSGIIQPYQHIESGREVFLVNAGSTDFFGEAVIPQLNMGKVKVGLQVLVKLASYPFEEYGVVLGTVAKLNKVPYRDSIFLSRVDFKPMESGSPIYLTTGMIGTAEIITEDATLMQRLLRSMRLVMERR
ncbi:hemolysin [Parapedobacter defluvii]|uniref:Hemolysin n=1 Tax=Parapedobacter defluvii TaxID=2045106 RepID=A0ABQ1M7G3_9SPHI|nr:HlyD family efflux transporter periplasmic adaptor subunit [Parapedobacter defluvii]GGC36235.1 hemolysin [Parapedobacter defluvii]